jgi:ELWxxDGT repeat protein
VFRFNYSQPVGATNPAQLVLPAGTVCQERALVGYNNKVYFDAIDPANGIEWHVYDPAQAIAAGTNPSLINTLPGVDGVSPSNGFVFDNKLLFDGFTSAAGHELWIYDAALAVSATNPKLAVDIATGNAGSSPQEFSIAAGKLFFMAENEATGREVWRYDPTVAVSATNPASLDLRAGVAGIAADVNLATSGDYAMFQGDSNNGKGTEPWVLNAAQPISGTNPAEQDTIAGATGSGVRNTRSCLQNKFCYSSFIIDATYLNILDPLQPFSATNPIRIASLGVASGDPAAFVTWSSN